jgi:hypothetical protein
MTKNILGILLIALALGGLTYYTRSPRQTTGETATSLPPTPTSSEEYTVDASDLYTPLLDTTPQPAQAHSQDEVMWLTHMREEEKLAHDVYVTLGEMWSLPIFTNIATSEATHTDAVRTLLDRYALPDTVAGAPVGTFTLPEIQALYTSLVALGSTSRTDALKVGATIEDMDIRDLDTALAVTVSPDIRTVYQNLQKGSRNHLRAFTRQITAAGGVYTPQYISQDAYATILAQPHERGRIR